MTHDPFELVRCLHCNGTGNRNTERGATLVRRVCRECSGTGKLLQGDESGPYSLTLDFRLRR